MAGSFHEPTLDEAKLREMILYIAGKCADDPTFGIEKLCWILWRADTLAYVQLGQSITGATYVKMPDGWSLLPDDEALK